MIDIRELTHTYDRYVALDGVTLRVEQGEIFGFLGPNGSGKTTLFRILSTLLPPQQGTLTMMGFDLATQRNLVRRQIGVVFQSPSLDRQLTAAENLRHHGHLYGLRGKQLTSRIEEMLDRLGLGGFAGAEPQQARKRVDQLSGGMRRRVEIAKGLLNRPRILLLDEPSTGLDLNARLELWRYLREIQQDGVTILLTTHLMDEAEQCSRLAILDRGKLLAHDSPASLKGRIGGDVITLTSSDPAALRTILREQLAVESDSADYTVRFERPQGHLFIPRLIEACPGLIQSVSVGKPTLDDVFIHVTGHDFNSSTGEAVSERR